VSTRRAVAWTVAGQALFFIIQFGGQVVLTRLLSPREVGIYAGGLAVSGAIASIQTLGLRNFLIREANLSDRLMATTFTVNAAMSIVLAVSTYFGGDLLSLFLGDAGVFRVIAVLSLIPVLSIFEFLPGALMQRNMKFREITIISLVKAVVTTGATILFACIGRSYMSMAWGLLLGTIISAAMTNIIGANYVVFQFRIAEWRRITEFGVHMMAISGVNQLSSRICDLILGHILGLPALGLFSRASNIVTLLWDNIYSAFTRIALADLSNQRRIGDGSIRTGYLKIVSLMTGVLWPAFGGIAVLSGPLINLIYGPRWAGAAVPLALLSLSAMFLVTITMAWEVFVIAGETGTQAKFEFVRSIVATILFAAGSFAGMIGAAGSRIVAAVFSQILYAPHLMRITQTTRSDYLPIYARSFAITLAALAPAFACVALLGWGSGMSLSWIVVAVLTGGVAWTAMIYVVSHPLAHELSRAVGVVSGRLFSNVR